MIKKIFLSVSSLVLVSIVMTGCTQTNQTVTYDENSWKTLFPNSCINFFDGCNMCTKEIDGDTITCTLKECAVYEKPSCLDQD